jgi:hypothetical protein
VGSFYWQRNHTGKMGGETEALKCSCFIIYTNVFIPLHVSSITQNKTVKTRRKRLGMMVHVYILGYLGTEAGRL